MTTKRINAALLGIATAILLPVGAASAQPAAGPHRLTTTKALRPEITTIKYETYPGTMDYAELASELGYLPQLTLDPIGAVTGGPAMIQAVATGQTVYGHAGNTSVISLVAGGAQIKSVLTYSGVNKRNSTAYYVLKSSPIKKAKQLLGAKVALNTLGAIDQAAVDQYLEVAKLTKSQVSSVDLVIVPTVNAQEALDAGDVQAAPLTPAQAAADPNVRLLFNTYQLYGQIDDDEYVMNDSFIAQYPNTTHILVAAMAKALVWSQTHPLAQVRAEYVKYLAAHNRPDEIPYMQNDWAGAAVNNRGGVIEPVDFTYWLKWMRKNGLLNDSSLTAGELYTNKFNPYATSQG